MHRNGKQILMNKAFSEILKLKALSMWSRTRRYLSFATKASLLLCRMVTSHTQDKHCNASGACVLKVNNLGLYTINEKQREVTTVISGTLYPELKSCFGWE